jgi:hypothetical protein
MMMMTMMNRCINYFAGGLKLLAIVSIYFGYHTILVPKYIYIYYKRSFTLLFIMYYQMMMMMMMMIHRHVLKLQFIHNLSYI